MKAQSTNWLLTFVIVGEFNPIRLANELEIPESTFGIKGELIREGSEKKHKETFWEISVKGHSLMAYDGMDQLLVKLWPKLPILKAHIEQHSLLSKLHIAINVFNNIPPAAGVPPQMINLLHQLNGSVTYDLYMN